MTLTALAFYLFATVSVASAFMVISARNPVYSVLWLILTFFNSAGLFVLMGAEFLAMILVVVYVGAVAVLFLFRFARLPTVRRNPAVVSRLETIFLRLDKDRSLRRTVAFLI